MQLTSDLICFTVWRTNRARSSGVNCSTSVGRSFCRSSASFCSWILSSGLSFLYCSRIAFIRSIGFPNAVKCKPFVLLFMHSQVSCYAYDRGAQPVANDLSLLAYIFYARKISQQSSGTTPIIRAVCWFECLVSHKITTARKLLAE